MARIGAGAQRDIYMSWEEAVGRAYERYYTVIDNYRRGLYPKHEKMSDEFYRSMAKYLDTAARSREAQQKRIEELRRSYDSLRNGISDDRQRFLDEMRTNRAQMKYELDDTREKMREKLEDLTERIDRFL